jgi:hypothetical protein
VPDGEVSNCVYRFNGRNGLGDADRYDLAWWILVKGKIKRLGREGGSAAYDQLDQFKFWKCFAERA